MLGFIAFDSVNGLTVNEDSGSFAPPLPPTSPPPPAPTTAPLTIAPVRRLETANGDAQRTPWFVGVVAIIASFAVGLIVWVVSKDALRTTPADGHNVWVPLATFATAGLVWGAVHPGANRGVRACLGAAVGAVGGALGELLVGSIKIHRDALQDNVLSGGTIGRALIWAMIGALAWGATIAVATPRTLMARAAGGSALGGAAIGASMGILAGTQLGSDGTILTDAWFTAWYGFDPKVAHIAPVLALAILVPLLMATAGASARRPTIALTIAAASCLVLPGLAAAIGHSSDLDTARRAGESTPITPGDGGSALPGNHGDPSVAGGNSSRTTVDEGGAVPLTPNTTPLDTVPVDAGPAVTTPLDTAPLDTTPVVATQPTVATDINVGFPVIIQHRFSGSNTLGEGFQGQMLIGEVYHDGAAPAAPDFGETCGVGPNDGVFPFYIETSPYDTKTVAQVRIVFSQTAMNVADSATYPLSIQFNDLVGPRCVVASDHEFFDTAAAAQWDTLNEGELGVAYGYIIVANYFDPAGQPVGAPSAVLAVGFALDHINASWSSQTYGTTVIDYDNGNGNSGTGFNLAPPPPG